MNFRLVDDQTQKVIDKKRQRQAKGNHHQNRPNQSLYQNITDVQGIYQFVLCHHCAP